MFVCDLHNSVIWFQVFLACVWFLQELQLGLCMSTTQLFSTMSLNSSIKPILLFTPTVQHLEGWVLSSTITNFPEDFNRLEWDGKQIWGFEPSGVKSRQIVVMNSNAIIYCPTFYRLMYLLLVEEKHIQWSIQHNKWEGKSQRNNTKTKYYICICSLFLI